MARARKVEGCRRQVVDGLDAQLALHREKATEPHPGILVALGDLLVELLALVDGLVLVAVVGLVVEHDDLSAGSALGPPTGEVAQHPRHHLVGGLLEVVDILAVGEDLACVGRDPLDLLAVLGDQLVVVGDHDLGLAESTPQVGRHEVPLAVVVAGVARQQHPQPVADGDAGGEHQEPLGEAGVLGGVHLVQRLPGHEHRHHHRLAGAGGHLQRHPGQARVVVAVEGIEPGAVVGRAMTARHLGEEDGRLGRLALAVKHPVLAGGVGPVEHQLATDRGRPRVVARPPQGDLAADVVDQGVGLDALTRLVEVECGLGFGTLLARRDRDERLARPSTRDQSARWGAVGPELEVLGGRVVGRVDDRIRQVAEVCVRSAHAEPTLMRTTHPVVWCRAWHRGAHGLRCRLPRESSSTSPAVSASGSATASTPRG